jgi:organic radical activating enzyme
MKITNLYKNCAYGKVQLDISFAGCEHRCKRCYVPELQNPTMFPDWSKEYIFREIEKLNPFVEGFVLLGGDPLYPDNINDTITLVTHLQKYNKPITMLTGYTEEEINAHPGRLKASKLCTKVLCGRDETKYKQLEIGK